MSIIAAAPPADTGGMEEQLILDLEEGFEPDLPIDGEPKWAVTPNTPDYPTMDKLRQAQSAAEGAATPPAATPPAATPPASGDTAAAEEEVFTPPVDNTDWSQKAATDLGTDLNALNLSPQSITSKDQYLEALDSISAMREMVEGSTEVATLLNMLDQKDEVLLMRMIEDMYPFEQPDQLETRYNSLFKDGKITDAASRKITSERDQMRHKIKSFMETSKAKALQMATEKTQFRNKTITALNEAKLDDIEFDYNGRKIKVPGAKIDKSLKTKAWSFLDTKIPVLQKEITTGEGYKLQVDLAMWGNPETRTEIIKAIAQSAYESGRSDEIKSKLNK